MDCIFCKIANKEISSDIIYEDSDVIVFNDLSPQAPVHFLVIPKKHIESVKNINSQNSDTVAHIFEVIANLAKTLNFEEGFRIVTNSGQSAGQSVEHLHFHVLSKRIFIWPPG